MPICTDCKHVVTKGANLVNFFKCGRANTEVRELSSLTGEVVSYHSMPYCSMERKYNWFECRVFGTCGRGARFFESKEAAEITDHYGNRFTVI
jgi:hypothetical protein